MCSFETYSKWPVHASKRANTYTHVCNAITLVWDSLRLSPTNMPSIFFACTVMTPGPVQNLKLTLDQNKPSLTLDWEPPTNIDLSNPSELTQYEISFKSTKEQEQCIQKIVSSPSTTLTLTRRSGLILDSVCQFSVRAKNCYDQTGQWVSKKMLIGMYDILITAVLEMYVFLSV